MIGTCSECHQTGRLNDDGVCEWRAGCTHRQLVASARIARQVEAAMADLCPGCGNRWDDHRVVTDDAGQRWLIPPAD